MVRQLLTAIIQINNHFNGIGSIYLINVSHLWGACNWYSYEYCTGVELQERKQMSAYAFNNNKAQRRQSTPSLQTHTHQNVHWETACLQALWRLSVTITHSHTPHCECVWESLCLVSSPGSRVAAKETERGTFPLLFFKAAECFHARQRPKAHVTLFVSQMFFSAITEAVSVKIPD